MSSSFTRTAFLTLLLVLGTGLASTSKAQPFTFELLDSDLGRFNFGTTTWGDVDDDGLMDVLLTGSTTASSPFAPTTALFLNQGRDVRPLGEFQVPTPLQAFTSDPMPTAVWHSAAAWGDYDGDGDLDLVLSGAVNTDAPFAATTTLLRNDGTGRFTPVDAGLQGLHSGTTDWVDYDNDGDGDLLLTGVTSDGAYATRLYRNDDGRFDEVPTGLPAIAFGDTDWGDYDGDGDLDLVLTGITADGFVTEVYRNDGGSLTPANAGLPGLAFSAVAWADQDGDGDLDLALAGGVLDAQLFAGRLFVLSNVGSASFTPLLEEEGSFVDASLTWADHDHDGDLDLLAVGAMHPDGPRLARLYENQDRGFEGVLNLAGILFGEAAWADVDNDGDLDLLIEGTSNDAGPLTNLYENTQRIVNTPPTAPTGLTASVEGTAVLLRWEAGQDDQTPAGGLTYNLRVGTQPGGTDVASPLADPATGRRLVAAAGTIHGRSWRLRGLAPGTYYWSVQTLDTSFRGSPFAAEGSFTIDASRNDTATRRDETTETPVALRLTAAYPNPFHAQTKLRYTLPAAAHVGLTIYDVRGRVVRRLVDAPAGAGAHQVAWDGRDESGLRLAPGLYLARLRTDSGAAQTRTLTLLP